METITNLEELPKEVWEELQKNAENMVRNAKISFWQGTTLLDLVQNKLSELKAKEDEPLDVEKEIKELVSSAE